MDEQVGWRALTRRLRQEAPFLATMVPQLPRLIYESLSRPAPASSEALHELAAAQRVRNRWLVAIAVLLAATLFALLWRTLGA
jgi:ubiquinone biosynthesis protein